MAMTPEVEAAIKQVRRGFPDSAITAAEDGQGGASVLLETVPLGPPYGQETSWLGFRIPFNCPYADVYPHFVRGDLTRLDGQPLGEATSLGTFDGRPAVQISRRSNRRDQTETPLLKALKVLEWLRRRP
jgi:hypothetical protein